MNNKVFVGSLSFNTDNDGLAAHFATVGTVTSAKDSASSNLQPKLKRKQQLTSSTRVSSMAVQSLSTSLAQRLKVGQVVATEEAMVADSEAATVVSNLYSLRYKNPPRGIFAFLQMLH